MSDGYEVNTDELEAVVKRLRTLQQNIGQTADKSKYNTVVGPNDFGGNFLEAHSLYAAHGSMQNFLSQTIAKLNELINEFGDKTKMVTDSYTGIEADHTSALNSQQPKAV
ncbi:hypothetical protein ACIRPK_28395 [Kitasatospora sp. NPDC101801]|uniref:hypothetical protein n=1 Tax=Kitasatospora sp. NPDC101801 TaxID=3364103 RepID=UPI00381D2C91